MTVVAVVPPITMYEKRFDVAAGLEADVVNAIELHTLSLPLVAWSYVLVAMCGTTVCP